jgi:hypothetical protein
MGLAGECIRELRTKVAEWMSIVEVPASGGRDNLVRHSLGDGETCNPTDGSNASETFTWKVLILSWLSTNWQIRLSTA